MKKMKTKILLDLILDGANKKGAKLGISSEQQVYDIISL